MLYKMAIFNRLIDNCFRFGRYRFVCVAAAVSLMVMTGCKKQEVPQHPAPLVTATEAVARDVPLYLDEIGTCTAREVVSVRPQATGQIVGIHFIDGADLKKGDPLFTIDPKPYQAALDQAKASLAQNEAALSLAKLNFKRAQELLPIKAISKQDYDTSKNAVDVGEAQVKASQAAIETAQVNLDYCFINSPIDGRASLRQVDIGNVVTANSGSGSTTGSTNNNVLLVIERLDPIYVDFTVTERDLSEVRRQMAKGTLKTQVRLPDEPESSAREGDLTFLDNAVQIATGTIKLRATLSNSDHHFWPGQFVNVRLVLSTIKDAVLVPSSALQVSQKGHYVFVVEPNSTADLRLVKLGQRQGEFVVVAEGLKAGEKIVTAGQMTVIPGGKVQLQEPQPQRQQTPSNEANAPKIGGKP
jgi:multidrug efflux system membrane fusion protein